jgi:hypothetical protein
VSLLDALAIERAVDAGWTSALRRPLQDAAGTDYYCDNDLTLTQPS